MFSREIKTLISPITLIQQREKIIPVFVADKNKYNYIYYMNFIIIYMYIYKERKTESGI